MSQLENLLGFTYYGQLVNSFLSEMASSNASGAGLRATSNKDSPPTPAQTIGKWTLSK